VGYKALKEPIIIHVNDLAMECGLFTSETELNGGYGCLSKSKQKDEPGKCYAWDCPLGYEADLEDLKNHALDLYDQWKEDEYDPSEAGANLVLQTQEIV